MNYLIRKILSLRKQSAWKLTVPLKPMCYLMGLIIVFNTGTFFNAWEPFTSHAVPKNHKDVVSKVKVL